MSDKYYPTNTWKKRKLYSCMEKYGDPWRISDLIKKKIYIFFVCLFCAGSIDGVLFLVTSWVQSFINIYSVNIVNLLDFGWEASDIVEGSSVSKIELFITKNAVSTVRRGKKKSLCWRPFCTKDFVSADVHWTCIENIYWDGKKIQPVEIGL